MSTCSPTALLYLAIYCLRSSFGPQKTKFESSTCTIKNLSDNENKLKDAHLFVARQLAQSGKQDKTLSYTSDLVS